MKKDQLLTVILVIIFTIFGIALGWFGNNILLKNEKNINDEKVEEKDGNYKENTAEKWENIELDDERFINIYNTLKGFTYDRRRAAGYKGFTNNELVNLSFSPAKVEKSDFTQISIENEGSITKS